MLHILQGGRIETIISHEGLFTPAPIITRKTLPSSIKEEFLRLLKEDEEFRYTVAGYIGLSEILRRLDRVEEEIRKLWEETRALREESKNLREDMNKGFERHDREIAQLREDMQKGFELVNRHISALGARWGIMAEDAFREGLRGLVEREFGLKVERWHEYDEEGEVFGYPSRVEVDIVVKDGRLILVEVSSHVKASDIHQLTRIARFYEKKTGRKPDKLLIVTPFADDKAFKAAKEPGVEIYTGV